MSEERDRVLARPLEDFDPDGASAISDLVDEYGKIGGFTAPLVREASDILEEMAKSSGCTIFLSFTANIVATGLRSLIVDMVKRDFVDAIVTTGGTVDHDIARSFGGRYYAGSFQYDDAYLRELEIHRLGNVLVPYESYGPLIERVVHEVLAELVEEKSRWSPSELLWEFGKRMDSEHSILGAAYSKRVPIFSPGIVDSAFGTALYTFREKSRLEGRKRALVLDVLEDMSALADVVYSSKEIGAIVVGGGISKHHVIWWAQLKGGLDYAIYITTAVEWDGSLSGAQTREAISWGKLKPRARHVTVYGDATVILPLVYLPVREKLGRRSQCSSTQQ